MNIEIQLKYHRIILTQDWKNQNEKGHENYIYKP